MNKNQIKGHAMELKGKLKEVAGKITGDKSLEIEGKVEKVGGRVEAKYGDVKDDVRKSTD